jgi:hypothetical protein
LRDSRGNGTCRAVCLEPESLLHGTVVEEELIDPALSAFALLADDLPRPTFSRR